MLVVEYILLTLYVSNREGDGKPKVMDSSIELRATVLVVVVVFAVNETYFSNCHPIIIP